MPPVNWMSWSIGNRVYQGQLADPGVIVIIASTDFAMAILTCFRLLDATKFLIRQAPHSFSVEGGSGTCRADRDLGLPT